MSRLIAFLMGLGVGLALGRRPPGQPETRVRSRRPVTPVREPAAEPVRRADPLTEIDGIGPAFEAALNGLGIYTFADLARQNPDDLAARLATRVTADRIRRDRWIEQAQQRADERA